MKRRALVVRTLTGAMSAVVFTSAGWLMGTRTLTMQSGPLSPCNGNGCSGANCGEKCYQWSGYSCVQAGCTGEFCRKGYTVEWGCVGWGCECRCKTTLETEPCGTCTYPCLN